MGLMDNLKAKLGPAKEKVSDLAQQHGDKVQHGIDRVAKTVDEKTKGKYSDRIHTGTDKAKGAMERLAHKDTHETGGSTPGATPPGATRPGPTPPDTTPPAGPPPTS